MIGAISGQTSYWNPYPAQAYGGAVASRPEAQQAGKAQQNTTATLGLRRAADPNSPVEPVQPVKSVVPDAPQMGNIGLAILQRGADPVEMAVRMRIQYDGPFPAEANGAEGEPPVQGAEAAQKALEEGKCQTCEERKYQDGSDDMGVSYQTPTRIDPDMAASAVRGHEMEHVVREQAKAKREDRQVVSQTVTLHTDICPECGKVYISGGTTRTATASKPQEQTVQAQNEAAQQRQPFSAVA